MEVDFDVPKFLMDERKKAPANLQHYFTTFEDLYERKLWHQLTEQVLALFKQPESGPLQVAVYQQFVAEWESKINRLSLVTIALQAARQLKDAQASVDFLQHIISKMDTSESQDVYVLAVMEAAHFQLMLGQVDQVKKVMESSEKILDGFDSVETEIYASFYRVSADFYKSQAEYAQYYRSALLFLACVDVDDMPLAERKGRAYDLAMSALLGDSIYNFGELLMHPILDSLTNTEHDWLRALLFAFNAGDIGKFESLAPHFSSQPLLQQNTEALNRKICLMSLIEAVFRRSADNRVIPFAEIASDTRLPVEEVEHLVMKALWLKLIKGSIDQVDQLVVVTWVQPRVLDKTQIDGMRQKIEDWNGQVKKISTFVSQQGGEVFAQ
ncbi:PCI-domain-containing protein [Hesseltinella vesiculosa]|uniref:PCI-domain-containing protein n=1 Tax=Hesseltinella vesiculosa TaxID=101127 RepID=A0A1X2G7M1_9FUNG|nr:PCI-domain-containing protein [Hesseltinella vesiculosa]